MNGRFYRLIIVILALGLGLLGLVEQAQAQFGAPGVSDLPALLVFGPWFILLVALLGAWWLFPAGRPRLCMAARRALMVYFFIEIVPISVCLVLKAIFDVGQQAGLIFWALSMMGVIFSGLVLLLFILVALTLDWVVYLWRRGKEKTA